MNFNENTISSQKWRKYFRWMEKVSVEPTMWLYMMAFMITSVVEQAFFVYKACRVDHGYSEEICANLKDNATINTKVQVCIIHVLCNLKKSGRLRAGMYLKTHLAQIIKDLRFVALIECERKKATMTIYFTRSLNDIFVVILKIRI